MRRRDILRTGAAVAGAGLLGVPTNARQGSNSFTPRGQLSLAEAKEVVVSEDGTTAYVAVTDGYATVDLSDPTAPTLLAERRGLLDDREDGPMRQIYDVKLSGETLAVVGPANPARGDVAQGIYLADVSDPANPAGISFYETEFPIHNCTFDGSHVYLTGNGQYEDGVRRNPVVIVDVSGEEPTEVARWSLTGHDETWESVPSAFRTLHDLWVRDGLAALAYWDAGTYLLDVSAPSAPEFLGAIPALSAEELRTASRSQYSSSPGNHHYVTTDESNELLAVGGESWGYQTADGYEGGPSGIDLYDVSDPRNPQKYASIDPPETNDPTYRGTWTTAHNFELREGTLYSAWYQGGVKRHDVSDPANPAEESWWADPAQAQFWTAQVGVAGEFFVASTMGGETADAGLWTFPETKGTGGDPAALTATPTPTPSPTETQTPTATAADSRTASPTPSSTPTTTAGSEDGGDTDGASGTGGAGGGGEGTTNTGASGFGVLTALGGLGVGAWRVWRGGDRESE